MKRPEPDDLSKEIFSDGELDTLRENSLRRGLAAQRSKRRWRVLRNTALAAAPMVALALLWLRPEPVEIIPTPVPIATAPSSSRIKIYATTNPAKVPPVPSISDDDLLALFADRPVGLVGQPGRQQLIVFAQPAGGASL